MRPGFVPHDHLAFVELSAGKVRTRTIKTSPSKKNCQDLLKPSLVRLSSTTRRADSDPCEFCIIFVAE